MKQFRRYYVLKPNEYFKLKESTLIQENLLTNERKISNILNNKSYTARQQIALINEMLYRKAEKFNSKNFAIKPNSTISIENSQSSAQQYPTKKDNSSQTISDSPKKLFNSRKVNKTRMEDIIEEDEHDINVTIPTPHTDYYEENVRSQSVEEINPNRMLLSDYETYDKSENERYVTKELRKEFGENVNLSSLLMRHHDDPNYNFIVFEDKEGTTVTIDKPEQMIKRQKLLQKKYISPSKTRRGTVLKEPENLWLSMDAIKELQKLDKKNYNKNKKN